MLYVISTLLGLLLMVVPRPELIAERGRKQLLALAWTVGIIF